VTNRYISIGYYTVPLSRLWSFKILHFVFIYENHHKIKKNGGNNIFLANIISGNIEIEEENNWEVVLLTPAYFDPML
jgi:hypothetical protein